MRDGRAAAALRVAPVMLPLPPPAQVGAVADSMVAVLAPVVGAVVSTAVAVAPAAVVAAALTVSKRDFSR
jgi:hypothetical protein